LGRIHDAEQIDKQVGEFVDLQRRSQLPISSRR
jgi:hypothetical protein